MTRSQAPDRFIAAAFREWADRKKGAGLPEDDIIYSIEQKAAELARESGAIDASERTCGCPPFQVCDYCQELPTWRREWQGSGPQRGFHVRDERGGNYGSIIAYLGDQVSGNQVDALIQAHNECLFRDAVQPPSQPAVELWKFVERAFDSSKTSTSERLLECLGLPSDDAQMPLSWHINRALALIDGAKAGRVEGEG